MLCPKRDVLFENYAGLVQRYRESVMALRDGTGTGGFPDLFSESEQIRIHCEKARLALEQHRHEHGC